MGREAATGVFSGFVSEGADKLDMGTAPREGGEFGRASGCAPQLPHRHERDADARTRTPPRPPHRPDPKPEHGRWRRVKARFPALTRYCRP
ncbi:hypothetical protein GCM10017567_48610 [Amycolatopsis bullii]|uniref:Uncharacterized protein n=1 Tax=Amycolatopsis bullii TaxID=941987 RepID=A0ABQ3KGT6_9PSEU|nr:hypothetical protein GCM10017567_48610 [Amycolatopsis bullii]